MDWAWWSFLVVIANNNGDADNEMGNYDDSEGNGENACKMMIMFSERPIMVWKES